MKKGIADPWPILIDFGIAHEEKGERLTLTSEAVGNARFSPDIMRNRLEEVPPWLDVYDLSQLLIWMLDKGAPKSHWSRPIHWKYAVYNETVPTHLQLSVRAFTGACSSPAISPAHAGEVVSLLSTLFPRQGSTKVGGIGPNVIANAKRQGTANRLIAESNVQEEIEGSAPLAENVYGQLRDTLLSVLEEVSQQEPSKRIIQDDKFHYDLVGATDLLWASLGSSPNNIHLRIKVKVVPWSDPPRADKKRKGHFDFWRKHMTRSAIPFTFALEGGVVEARDTRYLDGKWITIHRDGVINLHPLDAAFGNYSSNDLGGSVKGPGVVATMDDVRAFVVSVFTNEVYWEYITGA